MTDSEKCTLMVEALLFAEASPEKVPLLKQLMRGGRMLYGVKDVCEWTGWSEGYVRKMCQAEELPHIPGKELKFFYDDTMEALRKMQRGGDLGRRKRIRRKTQKHLPG